MFKAALRFLLLACASAYPCWAASDSFVGKWKLDMAKSRLVDVMKVEAAGANQYTFRFEGAPAETIVADGTDQAGLPGTTLSVSVADAHNWTIVRKKNGRVLLTAMWKLSQDGNTLRDSFTTPQDNGSSFTIDYVYQRTAAGSGFTGTWESTDQQLSSAFELQIQPYEGDGLSFIMLEAGTTKNVKFDGKDHANPAIAPEFTASGQRVDESTLAITDKIKKQIYDTQEFKLSPDATRLTMTIHKPGQSKASTLTFERE